MPNSPTAARWGLAPWVIDFHAKPQPWPDEVDFAVVGGGFTGLAAAAWLRRLDPDKQVILFEAECVGAGSSGHTGGLALSETAAGDLPGLGNVLDGFSNGLRDLRIDAELALGGVWELSRSEAQPNSSISWSDSGDLRVAREVPGGTIDPGKLVSGLARAAEQTGALIIENARVDEILYEDPIVLQVSGKKIRARQALIATNAQSLELGDLSDRAEPKFTLATATEPLTAAQLEALGLGSHKPFYTIDLPYLWGRLLHGSQVIFGSGLVHLNDWRELRALDIHAGQPAQLLSQLQRRVRGFHSALREVQFTHGWGGPILIADQWQPVFMRHPRSSRAIVLGAYSGHGVALSVYLGRWAAEAMLERRDLPSWTAG